MNAPEISSALPAALPRGALPLALAVMHRFTWTIFGAAEAFGLSYGLATYFTDKGPGASPHLLATQLVLNGVGAAFLTVAALVTDEGVQKGMRLSSIYPVTLLTASFLSASVQWGLHSYVGIVDFMPDSHSMLLGLISSAIDVGSIGGLMMMVYLQRENAQRLLRGIRNSELRRVQDESHVIMSRLAATHAQVDMGSLLKQLAAVRNGYATCAPQAEAQLESLIQDLRTCLIRSEVAAAHGSRKTSQGSSTHAIRE